MLFLHQIVKQCCYFTYCEVLLPNQKLLPQRFDFRHAGQDVLVGPLTYKPFLVSNADNQRLKFGSRQFLLLLFVHYLNCIRMQTQVSQKLPVLDPIALLTQELKDKSLKKQAVEELNTLALVLGAAKTRDLLVPLLIKTFMAQGLEMRVAIVKSLAPLLEYLQFAGNAFCVLEFIIDVLCVFSEDELRREAFGTLEKVLEFIDLRRHQAAVIKVIGELNGQGDKNIRELVLKLLRHVLLVADAQNEQYLLGVLANYRQGEEGQLLLAQQLSEFIKIIPPFPESEIHSILGLLIKSTSSKVRSKLINPLILLTKILSEDCTRQYFSTLLGDNSPEVVASVVLQIKDISQVFSQTVRDQLLAVIDKFQSLDMMIKNSILQVLQDIPLTAQRRSIILTANNYKWLNLSKTLANSLCKIHDIEAINEMIDHSDIDFRIKLFPKLPPTCEVHIKLMEGIFAQKNWRSKLTLLQNIQKRLDNQQNVEILIPTLLAQLGDKIAIFRMQIVRIVGLIVSSRKIQPTSISKQLMNSISSRNWFERQAVLMLIEQLSKDFANFDQSDQLILKSFLQLATNDKVESLKTLAVSLKTKFRQQK